MFPYEPNSGDQIVNPAYPANGVAGEVISVRTKLGRRVNAWRPTGNPANANSLYFCHGYSLGTAAMFGYTIFSGEAVTTVLADEWTLVGTIAGNVAPAGIRAQDIVMWWRGNDACHSVRVATPVYANGQLNFDATLVNSKTGTGPLRQGASLRSVMATYATARLLQVYRRALG
jgi:hypothetical protein